MSQGAQREAIQADVPPAAPLGDRPRRRASRRARLAGGAVRRLGLSRACARAGMQHPKLFDNPEFLTSLSIARWHIYGAAVGDLTLFAGAQINRVGVLPPDELTILCTKMIEGIFVANHQQDIDPDRFMQICEKGKQRIAFADWQAIESGATAFQSSSDAVFKWAPIADELKMNDEEIVRNSIHLRWIGVRRDMKELIRPDLIINDWQRNNI